MTDTASQEQMARKNFELNNDMITLDPSDLVFAYDAQKNRQVNDAKPWKSDPHYFQRVRISAVALIKMVMHARSGGIYEIMGLMQGKVDPETRTMYVMDSFALPVLGTETRVNASSEASEYMVQYQESSQQVGRLENSVGWYHSHPGYGCWLSGIDVTTQSLNQTYQDPWLAIVIDPNRTISAGKVDIGAFRTYPDGYKPPASAEESEYQSIPLNKIEDFGVHANQYYQLKVEVFKSSLDEKLLGLLWNKYWVSTISQSPAIVNRSHAAGQIKDLSEKLSSSQQKLVNPRAGPNAAGRALDLRLKDSIGKSTTDDPSATATSTKSPSGLDMSNLHPQIATALQYLQKRDDSSTLSKTAKDAAKLASEAKHGLMTQVLKDIIFNRSASGISFPPIA